MQATQGVILIMLGVLALYLSRHAFTGNAFGGTTSSGSTLPPGQVPLPSQPGGSITAPTTETFVPKSPIPQNWVAESPTGPIVFNPDTGRWTHLASGVTLTFDEATQKWIDVINGVIQKATP